MGRLSSAVILGISIIVLPQIALAADLPVKAPSYAPPPPAVYDWSGFYLGLNAGWGWNDTSGDTYCTTPGGVIQGTGCSILPQGNLKPSGGLGGGQIGYNFQSGQFVYGIEADFQGADLSDSMTLGPMVVSYVGGGTGGPATFSQSQKIDWFGTVRGRLGWTPWDRVLVYATGGLIYGHASVSENFTFPTIAYVASNDSTRSGWTVGGGLEYAFGSNATVRIEGLYYDMGDETISASPLGLYTRSSTFNFKGGLVRAALNYKFAP